MIDPLGHRVKAGFTLGRHTHLNHGLHKLPVGQVPVNFRRVVQNHMLALHPVDGLRHLLQGRAAHHRHFLQRRAAVLLQHFQQLHFQPGHFGLPFLRYVEQNYCTTASPIPQVVFYRASGALMHARAHVVSGRIPIRPAQHGTKGQKFAIIYSSFDFSFGSFCGILCKDRYSYLSLFPLRNRRRNQEQ